MLTYSFVLILSCFALVQSEQKLKRKRLPDYISPCSISATDFTDCVIKHGKATIPFLLKGDPKYKLRPLVPFFPVEKVELKPSDKLTLILRNVQVYGLDTVDLRDAKFDIKNKKIKLNFFGKSLKVLSNYTIDGQILVLPISGDGTASFTFDDGNLEYSFDYDLVKKDGKLYIVSKKPNVFFKVTKAHYQLDNLFNGNRELGENTNKVLNENSKLVLKDFEEAISEIIGAIATNIISSYTSDIPYEEFFLP